MLAVTIIIQVCYTHSVSHVLILLGYVESIFVFNKAFTLNYLNATRYDVLYTTLYTTLLRNKDIRHETRLKETSKTS